MDAFEKLVVKCRKNGLDTLIDNAAWDHALFLFCNLLDVAAEKKLPVRIITGSMNPKFYGDEKMMKRFRRLLDAGVDIEVLVVNAPEFNVESNPAAHLISEHEHGNVLVASEPVAVPHMLLIGDDASRFRFETDHAQTKAVASFNNPSMGQALDSIYKHARQDVIGESASINQIAA